MQRFQRAGRLAGWLTLFVMAGTGSLALLVALALRGEAWWAALHSRDDRLMVLAVLLLAVVLPLVVLALRLGRSLALPAERTLVAAGAAFEMPEGFASAAEPRVERPAVERPDHEAAGRHRPGLSAPAADRRRPRVHSRAR
jgi:hypothetical protein